LPWSVGDPLVFIEMLSILKLRHNAEEIDICVVYDSDNPSGIRREPNINSENAQDYMLEFLPLFSTSPYLGSIYQFNRREEFYRFLKINIKRYDIFPPLNQHLGETYNFFNEAAISILKEIGEFYNAQGYIPHLRIGKKESSWALWFYRNNLPKNTIPISLTLKRTSHDPFRNANPDVWLSFIDKCKRDFPEAIFVVVGLREEVFDGLRKRSNVIIAKDFGTSVIEDLALIYTSFLHMGTATGVNCIALFSNLPYLIFQVPNIHKYSLKMGKHHSFATEKQKIFGTTIKTTPKLIYNEFKDLYSTLDPNKWHTTALENANTKHSLPGASVELKKNSG